MKLVQIPPQDHFWGKQSAEVILRVRRQET